MIFEHSKFAAAVGEAFILTTGDGNELTLTLFKVNDARELPRQVSFSIVFEGPENTRFEQGLYSLRNETFGEMELFIVPVNEKDGRAHLEAVFNLLRDDQEG